MKNKWLQWKERIQQSRGSQRSERSWMETGWILLRTTKLMVNFFSILIGVFAVFMLGMGIGYVGSQFDEASKPDGSALKSQVQQGVSRSLLLYSDQSVISEVQSDIVRTPLESDQIADTVKKALISTEDATFYEHNGAVPKAFIRAALGSAGQGASSGGSTITQQLVKLQSVGNAPTLKRKFNEIVAAMELERKMSKEEILTTYLNVAPFGFNNQGREIAGVEEAARGIFGKSAKDLTQAEAAFIAGLPQSPVVYSPYDGTGRLKSREEMQEYGLARYQDVLYNLRRQEQISEKEYQELVQYDIYQEFQPSGSVNVDTKNFLYYAVMPEAEEAVYQYLIKREKVTSSELKDDATVNAYRELAKRELSQGGYKVETTIDKALYDTMQEAVAKHGSLLSDRSGAMETGSVLLDNKTGAILAFIGGRNYAENQNNHALVSQRNPGSTTKPFLTYGVAMDQGLIGSGSMVSDYPTNYSDGTPIMHAGSKGEGLMSLQEALNVSANIPAYWTYRMLRERGVDVASYMEKIHYPIDQYDIESLPIGGGIETTVLENTNAYQTLANGGVYNHAYMIQKITAQDGTVVYEHTPAPVQVYSPATASIMDQMLKEVLNSGKTTTFMRHLKGLNGDLAKRNNLIGKTGTSDNTADVWLMIASPRVTLGTWAGHDDNRSMEDLTGYNNNSEYVANLVNQLSRVNPKLFSDGSFQLDKSVIESTVVTATGLKPGKYERDGKTITITGPTSKSYWAKGGAPNANGDFMIGGTSSDKSQAFATISSGGGKKETKTDDSEKKETNRSSGRD